MKRLGLGILKSCQRMTHTWIKNTYKYIKTIIAQYVFLFLLCSYKIEHVQHVCRCFTLIISRMRLTLVSSVNVVVLILSSHGLGLKSLLCSRGGSGGGGYNVCTIYDSMSVSGFLWSCTCEYSSLEYCIGLV